MTVTEAQEQYRAQLAQEQQKPPQDGDTPEFNELMESLQTVPPSDVIEWFNALFYGDPGAGKTYLLGTAEDDERLRPILILDVEGGVTTLRHRPGIHVKRIRSMKELEDTYNRLYHAISNGRLPFRTVGIDSLTELADLDMKDIMRDAFAKNPDKVDKDVPSQREWGKSRAHIRTIVRAFRDLPCHVVYTASVATLQDEGQPTKYFPGFAGKLRTEVPGFMDIVGFLQPKNEGGVINRYLQVQGTHRVVAKDRTSSLGEVLTNTTLPQMWDLIHGSNSDNSTGLVNDTTPVILTEGES
jgi:AAA domain